MYMYIHPLSNTYKRSIERFLSFITANSLVMGHGSWVTQQARHTPADVTTCVYTVVRVHQLPDSNGVLGSSSAATAARACVSPSCAPADDMVPYACAASGGASRRTCCVSRSGSVPIMTATRVSMSSPQNAGRTVSCEFAETATHKQILLVVIQ